VRLRGDSTEAQRSAKVTGSQESSLASIRTPDCAPHKKANARPIGKGPCTRKAKGVLQQGQYPRPGTRRIVVDSARPIKQPSRYGATLNSHDPGATIGKARAICRSMTRIAECSRFRIVLLVDRPEFCSVICIQLQDRSHDLRLLLPNVRTQECRIFLNIFLISVSPTGNFDSFGQGTLS
jgi:hypothetical protein